MYKGLIRLSIVLTATGLGSSATAGGFDINPGMWETTYESKVTGGPPQMGAMMQQPPRVERECIKDNNYDFSPDELDKGCKFEPTRHNDKKMTWKMSCKDENGITKGQGEVNFSGNTIVGWSEMRVSNGSTSEMKIRDEFKGKRIGACK